MYVTCYYDIYNNPEKKSLYLTYFKDLANSGVPIVLFTDTTLLSFFECLPSNVQVIPLDVTTCEMYQIAMAYTGELPLERNPEKDTKEFFCLMNTKVEFIKKAAELFPKLHTFMWIDFGIMKLVKDSGAFLNKIKEISEKTFTRMAIPGCWEHDCQFYLDSGYWRFCGSFAIFPRADILRFYNHNKSTLTDFCTIPHYKLTWETNIWHIVSHYNEKANIDWYFAYHDESMLLNIDTILKK
jgi:hypothetical protein